jgi:hypothetical protein
MDERWAKGTPERAVEACFLAFRRRDAAEFVAGATSASVRALAARVELNTDSPHARDVAGPSSELTDSDAIVVVGQFLTQLPEILTKSVRCLIIGHVLESRLIDRNPDGAAMITMECRVGGATDEWITVKGDLQSYREIAGRVGGLAHVVFQLAFEFPGQGVVPIPPEPMIATTQLVNGEWRFVLDELSDVGLPGFRVLGLWVDDQSASGGA